jgi:hypothetical protein
MKMLPEMRLVFFSDVDVCSAALAQLRAIGTSLPRGTVIKIGVEGSTTAPRLTITIRPDGGGENYVVTLEREPLMAALIRACRARGVPLPRTAAKRVLSHGTGLMMMITVGKPPGGEWPTISEAIS